MQLIITTLLLFVSMSIGAQVTQYVDPRIGSEGLGRVFVGPSCPFGMVKPGPDCTVNSNAGWLPMPEQVDGFSQLHVSGTGGGEKYGNILIKPFDQPQHRKSEEIRLGYYACELIESGIKVEITTAERAAFYRISAGNEGEGIRIDLSHFLGRNPVPKAREAQQYEGSELTVVNDSVTTGWQCISGGWNNGAPYTVYFYAVKRSPSPALPDREGDRADVMEMKIGISFVSIDKAKSNLEEDIPHWDFERTERECIDKWEAFLSKVKLSEDTPLEQKKMFYTALYHTMLMPVDRRKDNGLWDDYYAIWDTYRTSTPLLTLLYPQKATDIANGLLDIYKLTGYMPDARSGNSNGRTQGGSNAEIVMADAAAKGLKLDYNLALEAMLKDATVPPTDDEAEGRGGLKEYNSLGYIPFGIPRAGNRTLEYSFCDWAISEVAGRLKSTVPTSSKGEKLEAEKYSNIQKQYKFQSERWKNLWNNDYTESGVRGFILPKDSAGKWLYRVPFGHSKLYPQTFIYEPRLSYEGPWYCAWWSCFMYEASSWEYSFSVPHDIPGLIKMCGGKKAFERRLDRFFELGHYNIANEPSFLTPCLYHWVGRPDKTNARLGQIVLPNYNATPTGIPGNDDSGSMSSWLAFHMMGLYPNAGHDYYIVHRPVIEETTLSLDNGRTLKIVGKKAKKDAAYLNGKRLKNMFVTHEQLLRGGTLTIDYTDTTRLTPIPQVIPSKQEHPYQFKVTCSLHGQTRRFQVSFEESAESGKHEAENSLNLQPSTLNLQPSILNLRWGIQRNLRFWQGSYSIYPEARKHATKLSYDQPFDGQHLKMYRDEIFCWLLSEDMLSQMKANQLESDRSVTISGITYPLIHHRDTEGTEMWVVDNPSLPIVWEMKNNANEVNWVFTEN